MRTHGHYVYFKVPYGTLAAHERIAQDVRSNLIKQGIAYTEHMGDTVWHRADVLQLDQGRSGEACQGSQEVEHHPSHGQDGASMNRQRHTLKDTLDLRNYLPVVLSLSITRSSGWYVERSQDYTWLHGIRVSMWKFLIKLEWRDLRPWRTL